MATRYQPGFGPQYINDQTTNRVTSVGSTTLGYDAAGQMTWG